MYLIKCILVHLMLVPPIFTVSLMLSHKLSHQKWFSVLLWWIHLVLSSPFNSATKYGLYSFLYMNALPDMARIFLLCDSDIFLHFTFHFLSLCLPLLLSLIMKPWYRYDYYKSATACPRLSKTHPRRAAPMECNWTHQVPKLSLKKTTITPSLVLLRPPIFSLHTYHHL